MKNIRPKTIFLTMLIVGGLFLPLFSTRAQTLLPFAGITTTIYPCTCSGTLWIWYTPLWLGGPAYIPSGGPMVYSPFSTILYAYYNIEVPGTYVLGSYTPGVQACWMYVVTGCVIFPSTGLMFQAGTNYL